MAAVLVLGGVACGLGPALAAWQRPWWVTSNPGMGARIVIAVVIGAAVALAWRWGRRAPVDARDAAPAARDAEAGWVGRMGGALRAFALLDTAVRLPLDLASGALAKWLGSSRKSQDTAADERSSP
jgi:hypothetical protein